jgi:hypothetical protein
MASPSVSVLLGPRVLGSLHEDARFTGEELAALRRRIAEEVAAGRLALVVTGPLLDELSAVRAADPSRYEDASRLLFAARSDAPATRVLRSLPERVALEIRCRGLLPRKAAFCTHAESAQVRRNARKPKAVAASLRLARHREAQLAALLTGAAGAMPAAGDEAIAETWCTSDLRLFFAREGYGLSEIEARWPDPREIPSLWLQRRFHVACARAALEAGASLATGVLDAMHFEDAAYAQVLVVADDATRSLASRAADPGRLAVVTFASWGRALLAGAGV